MEAVQDVLLRLQLDKRSLIIDSLHPEVAPHIVVTPPDHRDAWDLYWAFCVNTVGPQYTGLLTVPYQALGPCSLPYSLHPYSQGTLVASQSAEPAQQTDELFASQPRSVFKRRRFQQIVCVYRFSSHDVGLQLQVESAAQNRHIVYLDNVITAVQRHKLKTAVSITF